MIRGQLPGQAYDLEHNPWPRTPTADNFTIFEGTSEIQRMIIGRALTGLGVR